jgi:hypothetical protein
MTLVDLRNAVTNIVMPGLVLGADTVPTEDMVTQWLNDGQKFIAAVMPWQKFPTLLTRDTLSSTDSPIDVDSSLSEAFIKLIGATIAYPDMVNRPVKIVRANLFQDASALDGAGSFLGTSTCPIMTQVGRFIHYCPTGSADVVLSYVSCPPDLSGDSDVSVLGTGMDASLITYAVSQFYKQAEQIDLYGSAMTSFLNTLQGAS